MTENKSEKGIKRQDSFAWGKKNSHHFKEREVLTNDHRIDYPNNSIKTSKYSVINFLPKNLFLQFSKLSNDYFLIIGALSFIKAISTSNAIIVIVSAIKDIVEDSKRHRSDSEENNRHTLVLKEGKWETCKWRDLHVGNIVMVKENEFFPADIMILRSSGKKGAAFIETKNLDGETNLKFKAANKDIAEDFATDELAANQKLQFKFEPPNVLLYSFAGSFITTKGEVPLSEPNFILRGCSLRNTANIIGVVAYTGHHTKIMMNSIKAKAKTSKLEKNMNKQIIRVFGVQFLFCLFSAFYAAIWYDINKNDVFNYLDINNNSSVDNSFAYNFFVRFGNWILIFTNFVPISLLVTLEMVRLGQGLWMVNDDDMTSKADNTKPTVQSSNLTEELGQVEYIFSDKTGTLTKNLMEFKNLSVKGKIYGNKKDMEDISSLPQVTNVDFRDSALFNDMKGGPLANDVKECLIQLAICHTIITEEKEGKVVYNASSPDELALVNFAKFVGSEYIGMDDDNNMTMTYMGQTLKFKLLYVLEFNSTRKRMSVLVKTPDGQITLYCKGADSILFDRMDKNDPTIAETQSNLSKFATIGLRTLVLAKRVIDPKYWEDWSKRYHQASIVIDKREENMELLQEEIEKGLKLVGATAIEDKLQDDVDITISKLKQSGIKVWVLTGDKVETAINIGYSCKLLSDDLRQLQVVETTEEGVRASLAAKCKEVEGVDPENSKLALIISGEALTLAVKFELADQVLKIAQCCNAVLACRVSPKQKQQIVSMVRKEKPHVTTLAIGDGANDVNMIIAAHVGVGIRGVEGQQAARASDFAIGEFKILRRLLYYHGREAYRRNAYLILYNFYKNMVVVIPQFWFGFYSGFSGATIYDQILFQGFNIFYASVPIIIYAITDEEFAPLTLMDRPFLYVQGMKDRIFNAIRFWGWFFMGIAESAIILFWGYYGYDYHIFVESGGRTEGLLGAGMLVHSLAVWLVNFKIITISNMFNFLNCFFIFGSIGFYYACFYIGNLISSLQSYELFSPINSQGFCWFIVIICVVITYFWTAGLESYRKLMEMERNPKISPEEEAVENMVNNAKELVIEPKQPKNASVDSSVSYQEKKISPDKVQSKKTQYLGFAFSQSEGLDNALKNAEV